MNRLLLMVLASVILPGCADMPAQRLLSSWLSNADFDQEKRFESAQYRFDWQLSGEPGVGPLQVFDDGRQTWLQFGTQQVVPAIFSRDSTGDTLLTYHQQGPYVVLPGVWPLLVLRGGKLESRIERVDNTSAAVSPGPALTEDEAVTLRIGSATDEPVVLEPGPMKGEPIVSLVAANVDELSTSSAVPTPSLRVVKPVQAVPTSTASSENHVFELTAASFTTEAIDRSSVGFTVGPEDQNLRLALMRWARNAGWRFDVEHWDVDVDIPIVGVASFPGAFIQSVQDLTASTELGDRPVQPCFYSNNVLRIVPYAQACDRTSVNGNVHDRAITARTPS
jgi:hypothetical protein